LPTALGDEIEVSAEYKSHLIGVYLQNGCDLEETKPMNKNNKSLDLRRALVALSTKYQKRLRRQGARDQTAQEILAKLKQIREEIAARDYPG